LSNLDEKLKVEEEEAELENCPSKTQWIHTFISDDQIYKME
jgi:hypothetical protein